MDLIPTSLAIEDDSLIIEWNDATRQSIKIRELRRRCPCATCRDQREQQGQLGSQGPGGLGLPVLTPEQARPLTIARMEPAGNYAYTIHFSDGHSKGLFTFEFLKSFSHG